MHPVLWRGWSAPPPPPLPASQVPHLPPPPEATRETMLPPPLHLHLLLPTGTLPNHPRSCLLLSYFIAAPGAGVERSVSLSANWERLAAKPLSQLPGYPNLPNFVGKLPEKPKFPDRQQEGNYLDTARLNR